MRHMPSSRPARLESLESRLLLSAPPEKFIVPIAGTPGVDWAITAYTDQEPASGSAIDYRGRQYTFDGSNSIHFALPDFATMDRGIDVYAAAPGTVIEAHDGEYDRHSAHAYPPPDGTPDNYVLIDHGNGWRTRYGRLREGSVTVSPGQVVIAGQKIGQVGSSGRPSPSSYAESAAQLRFTVTENGNPVEPFIDFGAFWQSPPPYAGDSPGLHSFSPSASALSALEAWEGAPIRNVFHPGERVYPNAKFHGRNREALVGYRFISPDGTQFIGPRSEAPTDYPQTWRSTYFPLDPASQLGTWQVALEFDGVELGRTSFLVADASEGRPEIRVVQGDTYVVDGRTTPITFGVINQAGPAAVRTFRVFNYGTRPLTLQDATLPEGFSLASALPTAIPAAGFFDLDLRLESQVAGSKGGQIIIHSDDADNGSFDFAVKGTVIAAPWATPPTPFVIPIGGTPGVDWAITSYTDQEPLPGVARDYRGRGYSSDGSDSLHFTLPDLATMDRGIDVYAVAAGTVVEAHDGEYDRHLSFHQPPPPDTPDNYILIDHGGGWQARYGRLRNGSVAVSPGQVVTAGQMIGLVGASGNPAVSREFSASLRLTVTFNDQPVETFLDPASFWQSPPQFAGETPGLHSMSPGATQPSTLEAWEGAPVRHVFHPNERVYPSAKFHGRNKEALVGYRWYRPDGSQVAGTTNDEEFDYPQTWRVTYFDLGANPQLGTWHVALEFDGVELGRTSFTVAPVGQGLPEIKIYQGDTYIIDGRTTPIDFGTTDPGNGPMLRTFTLRNYGTAPLTVGEIELPPGFSLVGTPPTTVAANSSQTLTVQLDDHFSGARSGRVTIHSNDADQGAFDFAVKGTVAGDPLAITAAAFDYQDAPQRLTFTFNQSLPSAALAALSAGNLTLQRLNPVGGSVDVLDPLYDAPSRTLAFAFPGNIILPDGAYRATFSIPGLFDHALDFAFHTGDANGDGIINFDDYFRIDSAYLEQPANPTYAQGDFNYDDTINFDDYFLIDQAFLNQPPPPQAAPSAAAPRTSARTAWRPVPDSIFSIERVTRKRRTGGSLRGR